MLSKPQRVQRHRSCNAAPSIPCPLDNTPRHRRRHREMIRGNASVALRGETLQRPHQDVASIRRHVPVRRFGKTAARSRSRSIRSVQEVSHKETRREVTFRAAGLREEPEAVYQVHQTARVPARERAAPVAVTRIVAPEIRTAATDVRRADPHLRTSMHAKEAPPL
jgi:hypothetical protein